MILIQPSADGSSPFITDSPNVSELPVSNTITSVPLVRYGREITSRGTHRCNQSLKNAVDMPSAEELPCSSFEIGMLARPLLVRKKINRSKFQRYNYLVSETAMHTNVPKVMKYKLYYQSIITPQKLQLHSFHD